MALEDTMRQIREAGAQGIAVVSRDGTVLAADLPPGVSKETFSIMCATIHGAGMTVSNEMRRSPPRRITLEAEEGSIGILEAGRRALVVLVFPAGTDLDGAMGRLVPLLEQIGHETS